MLQEIKDKLSQFTLYFCFLLAFALTIGAGNWNKENKVIEADIVSYYAYLPATFIFHDLKLEKKETMKNGVFWPVELPGGKRVIKTSMGVSVLYSPFFFGAHAYEKLSGGSAYGFSSTYKFGLVLSSLFYFLLGLIFLRKILRRYFSENVTALTLLAVAIGTNLLYYVTREGTMSHVYNFALLNAFIWFTIKWYKSKKWKHLLWLGALSGFITLVRPSNIVILLFFFLYDVYSVQTLFERVKLVFSKLHWFVLMAFAFFIIWIPQFLYWKYVTGDYLFYSYTGERFFFNNPHIWEGFFSYRKGWLVYTPIMALALIGFPFLLKKEKSLFCPVLVLLILNIYIVFSWWCWWYGGSFGMRALIDWYGMLAIPMAALFAALKKPQHLLAMVVLVALLVSQNLFQMRKYRAGAIHWDSMTKEAFWFNYWRIHPHPEYWNLLKEPDYDRARLGLEEEQTK